MKMGVKPGEIWPMGLAEGGLTEVSLPKDRVMRYLARAKSDERARIEKRLATKGYVLPCEVPPSVLFEHEKTENIAVGVMRAATQGHRRLTVVEVSDAARAAEEVPKPYQDAPPWPLDDECA